MPTASKRRQKLRRLDAIAAFERTIVHTETPFDRYLRGDKGALAADQLRGFALFKGKAGCARCHNGPLLTDELFTIPGFRRARAGRRTLWRR
jgi:cytochrome c peroxidase